jgi:protein-S-isoprenylcysteine O-methyltransferase Ste14
MRLGSISPQRQSSARGRVIGLPLIAWGVGDLAGFLSNPARLCMAAIMLVQALIHAGLFKWIRYPSLFYLIFFCLGFSIASRSWIGLALMIPLMAGIFNGANHLDRVFGKRYRHEWSRRCYKSKRVIPFVY